LYQSLKLEVNSQFAEVDAGTLRSWVESGEVLLVDVRETEEFVEEHIPGALHFPLSSLNPANLPHSGRRRLVLHCLSGGRSARAREQLRRAGLNHILHLSGGLLAWKAAGGPTEAGAA
jgi:rhodanese-related sulfurtransferase